MRKWTCRHNQAFFSLAITSTIAVLGIVAAGQSMAKNSSDSNSLPLTDYRLAFLEIRDNPALLTEERLMRFTSNQVGVEASDWKAMDAQVADDSRRLKTTVTANTYEWQTLNSTQPALAQGSLLDTFMRPDADWSFVKRPENSIVAVFAFARSSVQGRQADFAAHELLPVSKQLLQQAGAKAPVNLWLERTLNNWKYDFSSKSIRFSGPGGVADVLTPIFDPASTQPQERQYLDGLSAAARSRANMWIGAVEKDGSEKKPGLTSNISPSEFWRQRMSFLSLPNVLVLSLDRQLRFQSIPMSPETAEKLQKGYVLKVKAHFTAEKVEPIHLAHPERVNGDAMVLLARLQNVELESATGEVFLTIQPDQMPSPLVVAASPAAAPAAPKSSMSRAEFQEHVKEENKANAQSYNDAKHDASRAKLEKSKACRNRVRDEHKGDPSDVRHAAFEACMQE